MNNINWEKIWFYSTIIFRPHFWFMQKSYSEVWDKKLNELMNKHTFNRNTRRTVKLKSFEIWTSNYPYSSFHPYNQGIPEWRPSRYTIWKAKQKLEKDLIENYES